MELGIKGKRALVCGGSKGLGFASAKALAQEGTNLIVCARNEQALNEAANSIRQETGVKVETFVGDLSQPSVVQNLVSFVQNSDGIDILVNNVGGPAPTAAATTSMQDFQKGFEQLFLSVTNLTQGILPAMRQKKFGRIITITSISVVEPIEHLAVSSSMRAAVSGFMKTLSAEVAADGITVNNVLPGIIHTARIEDLRRAKAARSGTTLEEEMNFSANSIPSKRLGRPEELGSVVAFLASTQASYVTGTNIGIDGGLRRSWT